MTYAALRAGIEDIAVVICPGDEGAYREAAVEHAERLTFLPQSEPRGYGHAIWCARAFVGDAPFLLAVKKVERHDVDTERGKRLRESSRKPRKNN